MTITAQLADGRTLEFPDGTDPSVVQTTVKKVMGIAPKESVLPKIPNEAPTWFENQLAKLPSSLADQNAKGGVIGGFVRGAADPTVGTVQLLANMAGQGDKINPAIQRDEQQYQEMRDNQGRDGIDFARIGGNIANLPSAAAMKIAPAASLIGRTAQGVGVGGGMGATAPVTSGDSFGADKLSQIGTSAAIGGVIPPALEIAKALMAIGRHVYRGAIEPFFQGGRNAAEGRDYRMLAGERADEFYNALASPQSAIPGYKPTAAEVVASLPKSTTQGGQAEFAGHQLNLTQVAPSIDSAVTSEGNKALAAAIRSFGGDAKSLSTLEGKRSGNAAINYGNAYATKINADPVLAKIFKNPFIKKEIPDAIEILKAKDASPKTDFVEFLHNVKVGLDNKLGKLGDDALNSAQKKAVVEAKKNILGWLKTNAPDYELGRVQYAADSVPVNQQQIGQFLENKLTSPLLGEEATRPGVFAQAMQDASNVPKNAAGMPRGTLLKDALLPQNMQVVEDVAKTMATKADAARMAGEGANRASKLTGTAEIMLPNLVNKEVSTAKMLIRLLKAKGTEKMDAEMARDMLTDTPRVAKLMQDAKTKEQQTKVLVEYLRRAGTPATNAAALSQEQ